MPSLLHILYSSPCAGCRGSLDNDMHSLRWGICARCMERLPYIRVKTCLRCSNPILGTEEVCWRCTEGNSSLDLLQAVFFFRYPVRELVHAFKQQGRNDLALFFSWCLHTKLQEIDTKAPLVPVPCLPKNKKKRGFDPVSKLCKFLEKHYGYTVLPCIKRKPGTAQKALGFSVRQHSLRKKLYVDTKILMQNSLLNSAILLDDVCTTGATLTTCAQLLKEYGIKHCVAISFAKTLNY